MRDEDKSEELAFSRSGELSTLGFFPWDQAARGAPYLAWNLCVLSIVLAVLRYLLRVLERHAVAALGREK